MANEEHLAILNQDVETWNQWRDENPEIRPDLSGARLKDAILHSANLRQADIRNASLEYALLAEADLSHALLNEANLTGATLYGINLSGAYLRGTFLNNASITFANLSGAEFIEAHLTGADLTGTNLSGAYLSAELSGTNFNGADLKDTNLDGSNIDGTVFANNDLSATRGLDKVEHLGPSSIGIDTIYKSGGNIPEAFLRGCGVPDTFITFARSLVNTPIDFYSCFISYSSKNQPFAERLYADLQTKGVRCWFAPEHLKIGEKIRVGIDESIRKYDKLLLVLSKHSVESEWVEKEVETAMEQERKQKRTVLFPIMLDNSVMKIESGWPADIRRNRNIGDFRKWKDHDSYQKASARLLRDLKAESSESDA